MLSLPAAHRVDDLLTAVLTAWWPHEVLGVFHSAGGLTVHCRTALPVPHIEAVLDCTNAFGPAVVTERGDDGTVIVRRSRRGDPIPA